MESRETPFKWPEIISVAIDYLDRSVEYCFKYHGILEQYQFTYSLDSLDVREAANFKAEELEKIIAACASQYNKSKVYKKAQIYDASQDPWPWGKPLFQMNANQNNIIINADVHLKACLKNDNEKIKIIEQNPIEVDLPIFFSVSQQKPYQSNTSIKESDLLELENMLFPTIRNPYINIDSTLSIKLVTPNKSFYLSEDKTTYILNKALIDAATLNKKFADKLKNSNLRKIFPNEEIFPIVPIFSDEANGAISFLVSDYLWLKHNTNAHAMGFASVRISSHEIVATQSLINKGSKLIAALNSTVGDVIDEFVPNVDAINPAQLAVPKKLTIDFPDRPKKNEFEFTFEYSPATKLYLGPKCDMGRARIVNDYLVKNNVPSYFIQFYQQGQYYIAIETRTYLAYKGIYNAYMSINASEETIFISDPSPKTNANQQILQTTSSTQTSSSTVTNLYKLNQQWFGTQISPSVASGDKEGDVISSSNSRENENEVYFMLPLTLSVLVKLKELKFRLSEDGSEYYHLCEATDPQLSTLNNSFYEFVRLPSNSENPYKPFNKSINTIVLQAIDYLYWKDRIEKLELKISAGKETKLVKKSNLLMRKTTLSNIINQPLDEYLKKLNANSLNLDSNKKRVPKRLLIGKQLKYRFELSSNLDQYICVETLQPDIYRLSDAAKSNGIFTNQLFYTSNEQVCLSLYDYINLPDHIVNTVINKDPDSDFIEINKNEIKEVNKSQKSKHYASDLQNLFNFTSIASGREKRKPEGSLKEKKPAKKI